MLSALLSLFFLANEPWLNAFPATLTAPAPIHRFEVAKIPVRKTASLQPVIQAKAALLMDLDSGSVLFDQNAYQALPMASLTKIMTAVVILENHSLDEVITIDNNYDDTDGAKIGFQRGEKISVNDMLAGMLVRSANDAAMILARYDTGKIADFVTRMNQKAAELNLKNTRFENPVGFDAEGHWASAYDLAILTKYALQKSAFRRIVSQSSAEIKSLEGGPSRHFQSTNMLFGSYLTIEGVKTGTTEKAGNCLINLARNPENQHGVIAVLLSSPNRFQESKSMIDWVFRNYAW